jgi:transcriptional regulator with XRE-family HTH domain
MNRHPQVSEFEQSVIDIITDFRKSKKITQKEFADILQLSRSFIVSIENPEKHAKYNLDHINALADYFNISPREFLPKKAFPV